MKYLNFTIAETSGRTFEVPMERVIGLVKTAQEEAKKHGNTLEVDLENDYEVARFLVDYCLDEISADEKANDYYEITLDNANFTGEG
jgi:hypothetical protein